MSDARNKEEEKNFLEIKKLRNVYKIHLNCLSKHERDQFFYAHGKDIALRDAEKDEKKRLREKVKEE